MIFYTVGTDVYSMDLLPIPPFPCLWRYENVALIQMPYSRIIHIPRHKLRGKSSDKISLGKDIAILKYVKLFIITISFGTFCSSQCNKII